MPDSPAAAASAADVRPRTRTARELRYEHLVLVIGACVVFALAVATLLDMRHEREAAAVQAAERSAVASYRLAERIDRLLQQADHTARLLIELHTRSDAPAQAEPTQVRRLPATDGFDLSIADANGRIVASTLAMARPIDVSERESFKALRRHRSDALYVAPPERRNVDGTWAVPVSRGIWAPDGRLLGGVAVLLDPQHWLDGFTASDLGPDAWAGVFDDDLVYRAAYRGGRMLYNERAQLDDTGPVGWGFGNASDGTRTIEGARRYVNFVRLGSFPLTVGVGVAESDALEAYEHWKLRRLAQTAAWVALTVGITLVLSVQFARLRRARVRVVDATQRLNSAVEAGLDAFFILEAQRDEHGHIVDFVVLDVNERGLQIFAARRDEIVGQSLVSLLPFARDTGLLEQCIAVCETRHPLEQEFRVPPSRLTPKWIHHYVVAAGDGIAITARDISLRKQQAIALDRERRFLKTLIDSLPLGITVKDARASGYGRFLFTNEEARRIMGVADTPLGKTAGDLHAPELARLFAEQDRQVLEAGRSLHFHDIAMTRHGETRIIDFIKAPVLDRTGRAEQLLVIAEDVTERRDEQQRLQLAREIFDQSEDMIVVSDAADRITFVNRAFLQTAGYALEQVRDRPASEAGVPPLPAGWVGSSDEVKAGTNWSGETEQLLHSGQRMPCWLRAKAVRLDHSHRAFIRVWSDITPLKRVQEELSHLAMHDELTGLANRVAFRLRFEQALDRARRTGATVVLYFIDMNALKRVNDELGHRAGDQMLRELARHLRAAVRGEDLVGRLGGDEFGVLAEGLDGAEAIDAVSMRIRRAASWTMTVDGHEIAASASVGQCVCPAQADTVEDALRIADAAMYREKRMVTQPRDAGAAEFLV